MAILVCANSSHDSLGKYVIEHWKDLWLNYHIYYKINKQYILLFSNKALNRWKWQQGHL